MTTRARIFLSCGQRDGSDEPAIARAIQQRFENELGFECYVAVDDHSPIGLRENIFRQLEAADYFVFIDFRRDELKGGGYRGSLFSHQELSIASYLEIPLLVFEEDGVKHLDGMMGAIHGNASRFYDRANLADAVIEKVKTQVGTGTWTTCTRNQLVLLPSDKPYIDADLLDQSGKSVWKQRHFHIKVQNLHHRKAAQNCFAYIESIGDTKSGRQIFANTIEFKWAGTMLPSVRIAPAGSRLLDAFHVPLPTPTQPRFNALTDSTEYMPQIPGIGDYELNYAVASDNFPVARATFQLHVGGQISDIVFGPT